MKPLATIRDPRWQAPDGRVWRVRTEPLDLLVAADTDRGALTLAIAAMRDEDRYQVEEVVT